VLESQLFGHIRSKNDLFDPNPGPGGDKINRIMQDLRRRERWIILSLLLILSFIGLENHCPKKVNTPFPARKMMDRNLRPE
jgi:hypothetical protein